MFKEKMFVIVLSHFIPLFLYFYIFQYFETITEKMKFSINKFDQMLFC